MSQVPQMQATKRVALRATLAAALAYVQARRSYRARTPIERARRGVRAAVATPAPPSSLAATALNGGVSTVAVAAVKEVGQQQLQQRVIVPAKRKAIKYGLFALVALTCWIIVITAVVVTIVD